VSLLAILELCRERLIEIIQQEPLGELQVRAPLAEQA
jgi:chromatin segregation and condensation protein Rec8/ScpA/Scc1 (kleisin family)